MGEISPILIMHITSCARSKIMHLLEHDAAFRIQAIVSTDKEHTVELLPNSEIKAEDFVIQHTPKIVADLQTLTLLSATTVDFDYQLQEFVITQ